LSRGQRKKYLFEITGIWTLTRGLEYGIIEGGTPRLYFNDPENKKPLETLKGKGGQDGLVGLPSTALYSLGQRVPFCD
jgi:hypothetical protein